MNSIDKQIYDKQRIFRATNTSFVGNSFEQ